MKNFSSMLIKAKLHVEDVAILASQRSMARAWSRAGTALAHGSPADVAKAMERAAVVGMESRWPRKDAAHEAMAAELARRPSMLARRFAESLDGLRAPLAVELAGDILFTALDHVRRAAAGQKVVVFRAEELVLRKEDCLAGFEALMGAVAPLARSWERVFVDQGCQPRGLPEALGSWAFLARGKEFARALSGGSGFEGAARFEDLFAGALADGPSLYHARLAAMVKEDIALPPMRAIEASLALREAHELAAAAHAGSSPAKIRRSL